MGISMHFQFLSKMCFDQSPLTMLSPDPITSHNPLASLRAGSWGRVQCPSCSSNGWAFMYYPCFFWASSQMVRFIHRDNDDGTWLIECCNLTHRWCQLEDWATDVGLGAEFALKNSLIFVYFDVTKYRIDLIVSTQMVDTTWTNYSGND